MDYLRYRTCLHITPDTVPSIMRLTELLEERGLPHNEKDDTVMFQLREEAMSFVPAETAASGDALGVQVTARPDGTYHLTTRSHDVDYRDMVRCARYVFHDVLDCIGIEDYAGYPVLHYQERSHPVLSFEYLRRLYDAVPEEENGVERFEVDVDGTTFVITSNGNIYPVVPEDGRIDLHKIGADIDARIAHYERSISVDESLPYLGTEWASPVLALHPDASSFIRSMHESAESAKMALQDLSSNERAVLVTSTMLSLLDALNALGPDARERVLRSDAYVCTSVRELLEDEGINLRQFVERPSLLSQPLIRQLHELQRTIQQLKPDVSYGSYDLEEGQRWVVEVDDETTATVILTGQDYLSGLEALTDPVWTGRVIGSEQEIPVLASQLLRPVNNDSER